MTEKYLPILDLDYLNPDDQERVMAALKWADVLHEGQWYGLEPYFNHIYRVVERLAADHNSTTVLILGALHDIIEDTDYEIYHDVEPVFGSEVAEGLYYLTREDETYEEYIKYLVENQEARIVKLADLSENIHMTLRNVDEAKPWRSLLPRWMKAYIYIYDKA